MSRFFRFYPPRASVGPGQTSMRVRNARRWAPRGYGPWAFALLALAMASALRYLLQPLLGAVMPATFFCIAAALTEYFFGLAPSLTVMTIGLILADYLFVPPYLDVAQFDREDVFLAIGYPLLTVFIITLLERLRRSQYRAQLLAAVARSRYEMLLRLDNERLLASYSADETHRLLRQITHRRDKVIAIQAIERRGGPAPERAGVPIQPGSRFADLHPDELNRLQAPLTPGPLRLRLRDEHGEEVLVDCVCERFATEVGDFLVLRIED